MKISDAPSPTPERVRQARGNLVKYVVTDNKSTNRVRETGAYEVLDNVKDLYDRGIIDDGMYAAGREYERDYRVGAMDRIGVSSWKERVDAPISPHGDLLADTERRQAARDRWFGAKEYLGEGLARIAHAVLIEEPERDIDEGIWEWIGRTSCGRRKGATAKSSGIDVFKMALKQLVEYYGKK